MTCGVSRSAAFGQPARQAKDNLKLDETVWTVELCGSFCLAISCCCSCSWAWRQHMNASAACPQVRRLDGADMGPEPGSGVAAVDGAAAQDRQEPAEQGCHDAGLERRWQPAGDGLLRRHRPHLVPQR